MDENNLIAKPDQPINHSSSPMDDDLITSGQKSTSDDLFRLTPSVPPPPPAKPPTPPPIKKEPIMDISQIKSSIHDGRKSKKWLIILIIIILLIATPVGLIYLTESGKINIGIDRIYAKTSIPELFGGISANTKIAITKSLAATSQITAFDFKTSDNTETDHGTIFNNQNYQYIYGQDKLMEVRRIDNTVYYTTSANSNQWTTVTFTAKNFRSADILGTYFNVSPYKMLEIAQKHLSESGFRNQITSDQLNVYKIYFTSESTEEKDQEFLEIIKSGSNEEVDPLYGVGEVELIYYLDQNYILKKTGINLPKYSKTTAWVEYTISNKTAIEKPKIGEVTDLDNAISDSQKQARDARRRSDLHNITRALQVFADNNNDMVPQTTFDEPTTNLPPTLAEAEKAEILSLGVSGNTLEKALSPDYIWPFPKDPSDEYYYSYISTGYRFRLYAVSEASTEDCEEKVGSHCFMSVSQ